jgi:hypothetical protein
MLILFNCIYKNLYSYEINIQDLPEIEKKIEEFSTIYEKKLGEKNCTHNYHLIFHIVENVRNFGPLWSHSCFPFENLFGKLKLLIFSSNLNIENINFFFHFRIYQRKNLKVEKDVECKELIKKLFKEKRKKISICKKDNQIKYFQFHNLYIYSIKYNKSKIFINYIIKYNNNYWIVLKIFFENDNINLINKKKKKIKLQIKNIGNNMNIIIEKNQIQCQAIYFKNIFVDINEPNSLL